MVYFYQLFLNTDDVILKLYPSLCQKAKCTLFVWSTVTASHPSLKGQTHQCMQPQEHWVGVHWESNLPLALVCITDYQCSGCRPGIQESKLMCAEQPKLVRVLNYWGGKHSDPSQQVNAPPRLLAKTVFEFSILTLAG